jgi:hypothetical protein
MTRSLPAAGWLLLVLGMLLSAPAAAAASWAPPLTEQALNTGFLTRLPAEVSRALGLSKAEEGTEVRQLLAKSGRHVRTFNVGVADHAEVVVFDVDARSGATVAYRLTPDGQLRSAVSYQAGGAARTLSNADAQAGFAAEVHFWSARAHHSHAAAAP